MPRFRDGHLILGEIFAKIAELVFLFVSEV
jgi:hypothetical protein